MTIQFEISDHLYKCLKKRIEFHAASELDMLVDKGTVVEPKQGNCKDCKWWKDSDGTYRRGIGAESICPINSMIVHDGDGYCYLFSKNE